MDKIQYQIITTIKESDKGSVYLASMKDYDFPVIVKKLKHANQQVFNALMKIECQHLPHIYAAEMFESGLLVVEEYIEGELLTDYLTARKLTEEEYLNIAKQLCEALKALHNSVPPLIHRDIKPSNIIINSKGVLKLIDFDSSRLYKVESDSDTKLLGTEKYAAPEQYGFSQTDCRSDIYSLGVVFGMFPEFVSKKKDKQWKRIVEKCTLFAPESRFQTVEEVLCKLEKVGGMKFTVKLKLGIALSLSLLLLGFGLVFITRNSNKNNTDETEQVLSEATQNIENTTEDETPTVSEDMPEDLPEDIPEDLPEDDSPFEDREIQVTDESYRTTAPEWRDIATDPEPYIELKKHIREHRSVVLYCFNDRLEDKDFLVQVKELERNDAKLYGVQLESHLTGQRVNIDDKYIKLENSILHISNEYIKGVKEGYYTLAVSMCRAGESKTIEHSIYIYFAETDLLNEPELWLQNTTHGFYGDTGETVHAVLKNDSKKKIAKILDIERNEVDASLYRILSGGRVVEFSNELLSKYSERELAYLFVVCDDGSYLDIQIYNNQYKE